MVIVSIITTVKYVRQLNEERERIVQEERFNRAVNREYKQLVNEYDDVVETIKDNGSFYSSILHKAVIRLNDLLGGTYYPLSDFNADSYSIQKAVNSLKLNRSRDLELLKSKAKWNVLFSE